MADQKTSKKGASSSSVDDGLQSLNTRSNINNKTLTSSDKTQELHNNSAVSSREQDNEDYQVGDIVWAKIGKYPYWPSIVCYDPDSNTYMKGTPDDKKKFSLHVRFCNDNGRRSWAKILENYNGKEDLLLKYPSCVSFMKNSKKQMNTWNAAIKEADGWLKFGKEERWLRFTNLNNIEFLPFKSPPQSPLPKSEPSTSATTSNISPRGTNAMKKKTAGTNQNAPDCYIYLKKLSVGHIPDEEAKKRKIVKKKTKKVPGNSLNNYTFTCPEQNYHIDDEVPLIPTHPQRRVLDRIKSEVEKLEAEGIRKIREWKASKLAKAANASIATASQ